MEVSACQKVTSALRKEVKEAEARVKAQRDVKKILVDAEPPLGIRDRLFPLSGASLPGSTSLPTPLTLCDAQMDVDELKEECAKLRIAIEESERDRSDLSKAFKSEHDRWVIIHRT